METSTFRNYVLKSGVLIGLVNVILVLAFYVIDPTKMASFTFMGLTLLINLILLIYSGITLRKMNGGFLSFKNAFVFIFLAVAVSSLIGTIFNISLYHLIDPDLKQVMVDASLEMTQNMMEKFGAPADALDEAMAKAEQEALASFTVSKQMMQFVWNTLIGGVLFGLIIGAIIMKKPKTEI